ncbi:MAG: threo-3-hydroxy-L-aspartate ammonia-lyase [Betaproteobacteria bacterium]|nr:threo-3-hydroxy-L-aspartate ammonia-lyase [Betaproteobacteria bacterium]
MDMSLKVSWGDVAEAHERIRAHARRTPVLDSATVNALTGARVFFKCENFQRMGAFKFRGAYNALSRLSPQAQERGVVAFSSGNHAQAVALAGRMLGIPRVIVMPQDAPRVKLEATRGYGAQVVTYGPGENREETARRIAGERGLSVIPPFNHPHIVAGQGTAAKELLEETGPLDVLLVPCGGGGLLTGCAVAAKHLAPGIQVIGVEPQAGDDATRSFWTKTLQSVKAPQTIADGARTESMGDVTFPLMLQYVDEMMTASDADLLKTMFFLWERMKFICEPTGALGAAALLQKRLEPARIAGKRVGVVISGGNVDLAWAATQLRSS